MRPADDAGGEGLSPAVDGKGSVHIGNGIPAVGDLEAAMCDGRKPVRGCQAAEAKKAPAVQAGANRALEDGMA